MQKNDFYCEKVLSGKTEVNKIYESKLILAFYHTKPLYKYHIVIIPKEHITDLVALEEEHKEIIWMIVGVAKNIIKDLNLKNNGVRLITNLGKYQDSPHLHFHLISGEKIKN